MKFTVTDTNIRTWKQVGIGLVTALGLIAEGLHEIAAAIRDSGLTKEDR